MEHIYSMELFKSLEHLLLFWCFTEEQVDEEPALAHEFPQDETTSLEEEEQHGKKNKKTTFGLWDLKPLMLEKSIHIIMLKITLKY